MRFVVLDLEWNQAESSKSSVFNRLPFYLHGEIIQIGAVKLTDDFKPSDEFKVDIKPVYFRRMHHKVKQLTGIDKERLKQGLSFETAMEWLREWCGSDDCVILTWGYDDKNIMEQNLMLFDVESDWMGRWVNLQPIYNVVTNSDNNQKSLKAAMEFWGIEQTRVAHDAQGDAYNTALVCSKLGVGSEIAEYGSELFSESKPGNPFPEPPRSSAVVMHEYPTLNDAFSDVELAKLKCPYCGILLENMRWVSQGDGRYMTLSHCEEHGAYLLRLRFKREAGKAILLNRLIYEADEEMQKSYHSKATQKRRVRSSKKDNTH